MPRWNRLYQQLKRRRVIRAAVVFFAVFWLALQVADLLVESNLASEQQVRWLIIGGLALLPLILILSWFFEHPWHQRAWTAMLGDLALVLAVAAASGLLAWQQWSKFTERPVLAVLGFTPTDTRESTRAMANHLGKRLHLLFATAPGILVLDLESSRHPDLEALPVAAKAERLGADYLLAGTVNQSNLKLRLNVQLFDAAGELLWSDRFGDRIIDQFQLQSTAIAGAWPRLGLPESGMVPVMEFLQSCEYPADREAILALVGVEQALDDMERADGHTIEEAIGVLDPLVAGLDEVGLLYLARARARDRLLPLIEPAQLAIQHRLLASDLEEARIHCPSHPGIELMRLLQSRELEGGTDPEPLLARHPNSFPLYNRLARVHLDRLDAEGALGFVAAAYRLNPLNAAAACRYRAALLDRDPDSGQDAVAALDARMAGRSRTNQCRPGIEY